MDDFILRALVAGIGIALVCGPLGCFVVWQRMAYFGATLSHAALLGLALGFLLGINRYLAVFVVCLLIALLYLTLDNRRRLNSDTVLGILAHASLALGIVALSFIPSLRIDLMAYLFGDILAVGWIDLAWIWGIAALVGAGLLAIWRPLLSLVVQRDLALADGVNERLVRALFVVMLSLVVAISMQIVGILLVVSMLIIPPAAARYLSRSPEQMALLSIVLAMASVILGLFLSLWIDAPAGPAIVLASALLFAASLGGRLISGNPA